MTYSRLGRFADVFLDADRREQQDAFSLEQW